MLINFTQKRWPSDFLNGEIKAELLHDPFCRATSRLRYQPDLFRYALCSELIPDLVNADIPARSWAECCYERAQQLLAQDRQYYLLAWSGGIDSTGMMSAILETWPPEALDKITLFLSHSSIAENPEFYDRFLSSFPAVSSMSEVSADLLHQDMLLVTGELGDQLFGSDILSPAVEADGSSILWRPYQDEAARVIELWTKKQGTGAVLFEHFHPIVAESPVPIRNVFDFFWWLNFSQKWQHVKFRFLENKDWDLRARYGQQILHFFDTPTFQKWSLGNHDQKIGTDWTTYKLAAKEFIFAFTKNSKDKLQRKIPSLALRNFLLEKRIAITVEYTEVATAKELQFYVR